MDQGGIVHSQIPIHPEYDESEQQDSFDGYAAHTHHQATYPIPAVDLRREAPLHGDIGHVFPYTAADTPRYAVPTAAIAQDPGSFRPAHGLGEGTPSSSISPHPSLHEAAQPYSFSHHPNYTHAQLPVLHPNLQQPSLYLPGNTHAGHRLPSVPEGLTLDVQPRFRPSDLPSVPRGATFFNPLTGNRPPPTGSAFAPLLEAPRAVQYAGLPAAPEQFPVIPPVPRPAPQQSPSTQPQHERGPFPFPTMAVDREVFWNGRAIGVSIFASIDKALFPSSNNGVVEWTCYRRNYFTLTGYYILDPHPGTGGVIFVVVNGRQEPISAFGLRLISHIVDGENGHGKAIELVQHTPKRDAGPKYQIEIVKVSPAQGHDDHHHQAAAFSTSTLGGFPSTVLPGPYLPCQGEPDPVPALASNSQAQYNPEDDDAAAAPAVPNNGQPTGMQTKHVFDRVQFKCATANNGKRRASQQYFQLIVELHADIRQHGSTQPHWVRVATRTSEKIVVRGRSPSHYQGGDKGGRTVGGSRAGSAGSPSLFPGPQPSTYGNLQSTGGRAYHHSGYGGTMTGPPAPYRTHYPSYDGGDQGASVSPTDIAGGTFPHAGSLEGDHAGILDPGYRYFPGPIYEATPQPTHPSGRLTQLPVPKVEDTLRRSTDPGQYAVRHDYPEAQPGTSWLQHPLDRFQSVESSSQYYPHFPTAPHSAATTHLTSAVEQQPEEDEEQEQTHRFR